MSRGSRSDSNQTTSARGSAAWPLLLATTIFFASGETDVAGAGYIPGSDKLAHAAAFGLLATLVLRSLTAQPHRLRPVLLAIAITSAYGMADEYRQSFTPGRSVEIADWVADTAGAFLAAIAYGAWSGWRGLLERRLRGRRAASETGSHEACRAQAAPERLAGG